MLQKNKEMKFKILTAAKNRRAIKIFDKNRKITNLDFEILLQIANESPSSFGLEPWKILVVQNEELRASIKRFIPGAIHQIDSCSHFVIFTVSTDLLPESNYFRHINLDIKGMNSEDYDTFKNRLMVLQKEKLNLVTEKNRIDWAGKQAYLALGNMIMAASILKIDSCPIEGFFATDLTKFLIENKIIEKTDFVTIICAFGYRIEEPKKNKIRRALSEVVKIV